MLVLAAVFTTAGSWWNDNSLDDRTRELISNQYGVDYNNGVHCKDFEKTVMLPIIVMTFPSGAHLYRFQKYCYYIH